MFACFELRKLSFEMKRPRGQKPGSAAEGEVRPPKVAWFCMHVRPPKEESVGHYKSPFARDLSVKHSVFGSKVGSSSPWCDFSCFPQILHVLTWFELCFRDLSKRKQSWALGEFDWVFSYLQAWIINPLVLQEVSMDPHLPLCLKQVLEVLERFMACFGV